MKKEIDDEAMAAVKEIDSLQQLGRRIVRDAAVEATSNMVKMISNPTFGSKGSKVEMLKHHAVNMGIATEFMDIVVPQAAVMEQELAEKHRKAGIKMAPSEGKILTAIWLAKVFTALEKEMAKHGKA